MLPTTALHRMRDAVNAASFIGAADGQLREALYPAPGIPQKLPCLVLFWGETTIEYSGDHQTWLMTGEGWLLIAPQGDTPREIARIDPLLAPLADLFDPNLHPENYRLEAAGSIERVSHCFVRNFTPSVPIAYASEEPNFLGHKLFFDVKLKRNAGDS